MLSCRNAVLFVNGKLLLNDASLTINKGDKIGIVGRNGSGKSHLLRMLAGTLPLDGGERKIQNEISTLLIKQELPTDDQTPLEYIKSNDPTLSKLNELIDTESSDKLAALYLQLDELEEERYSKLAPEILIGLGLTQTQLTKPMRHLPGGLRMRISLAMGLIYQPDILFLDEPTNHLDYESTQWLIGFLKSRSTNSALIIVTHDVLLLTAVTTTTMHLRGGTLTEFKGDFVSYTAHVTVQDEKAGQKNADLDKQIQRKMKLYYAGRDSTENRAAHAVAQKRHADKLAEKKVEIIEDEPIISFTFPDPDTSLSDPIVDLKNICIGYQSNTILKNLNLSIQYGSKIGLLGCNGEGKTSLIKVLANKLQPFSGIVDTNRRLKIGYFSQELTDELNNDLTAFQQFQVATQINNEAETRSKLARFGFSYDKINTKVINLSGGEKSRLLFSIICSAAPNMIILDEPTNHLDIETREVLMIAIKQFKGTVVLVSHDRDLHEKTMNQFWLAKGGKVESYKHGLKHYEEELKKAIAQRSSLPEPKTQTASSSSSAVMFSRKKPATSETSVDTGSKNTPKVNAKKQKFPK